MSTKVIQRTPSLGLRIRLQPAPQAAAPCECESGGCDVDGVAWAVMPQYIYGPDEGWGEWASWQAPALGTEVALAVSGDGSIAWSADPGPDTFMSVRVPVYLDSQPVDEWPAAVTLVAVAYGADVSGVSWNIERGSDLYGVEITPSGPLVVIRIPAHAVSGDPALGFDDISLIAHCGGAEVGALRLQVFLDGW